MSDKSDILPVRNRSFWDPVIDLIGGTAGAIACVYVGQPLDTVKVKMQTFPDVYRNALNCFVRTYKDSGVRGLYSGTIPSLVANIGENAALFASYGVCQKLMAQTLDKSVNDLSDIEKATAGSIAAFSAAVVLTPTELVKCRMQAAKEVRDANIAAGKKAGSVMGPFALTRSIVLKEGLRGLFHGFVPTCAREMPGYFFFFGGYEATRSFFTPPGKDKNDIGVVRTMISGGVGGISLWLAVFPADVVKSRVQVSEGSRLGFFTAMRKIAAEEGFTRLYRGLGPTLVRAFPAAGTLFLAYETTKKLLSRQIYRDFE